MTRPFTVAIVAGELSGDQLGRGLMDAIRARVPQARFIGIGGPNMKAAGFESWFPMERLAVMGITEVLGRLPELLLLRHRLVKRLIAERPDVCVGIDSPDFNLGMEQRLREAGLRTVHYVSPSVWAWRQGRVRLIRRAVDRVLTLLPFEATFYQDHQVPVSFVGHPLADLMPLDVDAAGMRRKLGIDPGAGPVVAVLPGSRGSEVTQLLPPFVDALRVLSARHPGLVALLPAASEERRRQIEGFLAQQPAVAGLRIIEGRAREAMAASDVVLLASGTATLEGLLAKRPMVVAYRFNKLTWIILSLLVRTRFVALPNLLANDEVIPEVLQQEVNAQRLADEVDRFLGDQAARQRLASRFHDIHLLLRRGASERAAEAVLEVAGWKR
jgi:lipid-A-disaccharide synthase